MTPFRQAASLLVRLALFGAAFSAPAFAQQLARQGIASGPQFTPGLVLRYHVDLRTTHNGEISGVAENPQGANWLNVRFSAALKIEAFENKPGELILRLTIEQVSVAVGGDTFDPTVVEIEHVYRQLEGYSVFFSGTGDRRQLPEGSGVPVDGPLLDARVESWMSALVTGLVIPTGATPGKSWSAEQLIADAPLKGLALHCEWTYLRDEPCGGGAARTAVSAPSLATESCAVVLARTTIKQYGGGDPTPDVYRSKDLRTAGRFEGSGETLTYISHRTGWLVSVTETQGEEVDFTVTRATGETVVHKRGTEETEFHVLLQSVEKRK